MTEQTATLRQVKLDRGEEIIVGVNKYRLEDEDELEIRAMKRAMRTLQIGFRSASRLLHMRDK